MARRELGEGEDLFPLAFLAFQLAAWSCLSYGCWHQRWSRRRWWATVLLKERQHWSHLRCSDVFLSLSSVGAQRSWHVFFWVHDSINTCRGCPTKGCRICHDLKKQWWAMAEEPRLQLTSSQWSALCTAIMYTNEYGLLNSVSGWRLFVKSTTSMTNMQSQCIYVTAQLQSQEK